MVFGKSFDNSSITFLGSKRGILLNNSKSALITVPFPDEKSERENYKADKKLQNRLKILEQLLLCR